MPPSTSTPTATTAASSSMGGSHTLEQFINGVARDIEDPETKMTVWQRLQLAEIARPSLPTSARNCAQRADLRINALGSGTDFTAFLDHLGIATLDLGYGGEDEQGIYHSIYDDFYWYTHFSDYDFVYGRALSQTVGTSVMRLADAEVLPFDFVDFADTIQKYTKDLKKLLADKQEEIRERNQELDEGVFKATLDPRRPTVAPPREEVPPHLNFAPMQNAVESLTRSAEHYQQGVVAEAGDVDWRSGGIAARVEPDADRERAQADQRRRTSAASVVQASSLRSRRLQRIRREDRPERARRNRTEEIRGGRAGNRARGESAGG